MKTYTGATLLCALLERQGIDTIAGIPGGAILPFYDALHDSAIRHVLARHEQGAGFIAQGMARATGKAAVCVATSGPGATNLLTAIADARLDSIPLVAITGQVPQSLIGTDAFQEVDTYGLTVPITKHNFLVRSAAELLEVVPLAFEIAESGRPGPVLIDVPKDVLNAKIEVDESPEPGKRQRFNGSNCRAGSPHPASPKASIKAAGSGDPALHRSGENEHKIAELAHALAQAQRPVLYFGGGIIGANASDLARELAERLQAPVVSTLMALGAMPDDHPLFMGMLGMHGRKGTNQLLQEADFILAIGARFDDRATGKVAEFCPNAKIAHIDIDRAEIGKIKTTALGITGDAREILGRLLEAIDALPGNRTFVVPPSGGRSRVNAELPTRWTQRAAELREAYPLHRPSENGQPLHPLNIIRAMAEELPADTIITTDVGQHQMWVAQAYPFREPRTLLTSGGLGTMGFGLPAAIGAALAQPGRRACPERSRRVVCVSGDGSILMNVQELATLAELDLPVAIVLMNNDHLGLVRQQQELFYNQRYAASHFHAAPDFAALAKAFGIRGVRLQPAGDPLTQLREALRQPGPVLIDVPIETTTNVYPMVPPGAANHQTITAPELELADSHA